jgi:hypothetical protein
MQNARNLITRQRTAAPARSRIKQIHKGSAKTGAAD